MPTIGGTALSNARRIGQPDAVVTVDRRWSWSDLNGDIGDVAAKLVRLAVRKGDRMALLSANTPEFIIASHAASRLGAIVVPVSDRWAPPELADVLNDSGASVLAFEPNQIELVETVITSSGDLVPAALGPSGDHVDLMDGGESDPVHEDRAVESDDAFILYTSGTTGKPKGCLLDHHRAVWAALAQIVSLGLRDGDRHLHLAPIYHSGRVTFLHTTTLLGSVHIVVPKFDPRSVLALVERFSVTWLFGVPTMYQQILRLDDVQTRDTSSWRVGVFGAAPMPAAAIEELLTEFPGVDFFQQCGQRKARRASTQTWNRCAHNQIRPVISLNRSPRPAALPNPVTSMHSMIWDPFLNRPRTRRCGQKGSVGGSVPPMRDTASPSSSSVSCSTGGAPQPVRSSGGVPRLPPVTEAQHGRGVLLYQRGGSWALAAAEEWWRATASAGHAKAQNDTDALSPTRAHSAESGRRR